MRISKLVLILLLLFIIAACGADEASDEVTEAPADQQPTAVAVASETATLAPPTATSTSVPPTATAEPTAEPTATASPEAVDANCVSCHADQEQLIAVAAPEIAPEEGESSGVG
jgi:cytochrome c553